MKIMIINGPNLNMVGIREKKIYGNKPFADICHYIENEGKKRGHEITIVQTNSEGKFIDYIQTAYLESFQGIIINPGAYSHYSYAILDAIRCVEHIPTIEVHLSNIHGREDFRNVSITASACIGQICGLAEVSYILAMIALEEHIK